MKGEHVTIERTAKKYKLRIALAVLGMFASVIWGVCAFLQSDITQTAPNLAPPSILFAISIIVYLATKVAIWWNHG